MFKKIFRFELRYQLKQPLFLVSTGVFFLLGLALATSDIGTAVGEAPGTAIRNAPIVVIRLMPILSLLGLFVTTAFIAGAALRDFERRSDMLFFTKPVSKFDFLTGRFAGSLWVSLLVLAAGVLGLWAGNFAPWQPADRLGPVSIAPYLFGLGVIIVPNLLVMGALFFALAIWSRRFTLTYLCVVFFVGMQDVIEIVAQNLENRFLGSVLEPAGVVVLETVARYWTLAEQSVRLPELGGVLLVNRLAWMLLALGIWAMAYARFDFSIRESRPKKSRGWFRKEPPASTLEEAEAAPGLAPTVALLQPRKGFSRTSLWRRMLRQARVEVTQVIYSTSFLTLLAFGLMFVMAYSFMAGSHDGMPSYPLTHLMLQGIGLGVRMTLVLILVLYAGELVFSRRSLQIHQVYDALPVPNSLFLGAKILALLSVVGVFLISASLSTLAVQLAKGFSDIEPSLYFKGLWILALPMVPLIVLAICLQIVSNHKLVGLLLTALVLLLGFALPRFGFENNLYLYGGHSPITYAGLNGYGHQLAPFLWFMAYWSFGAVLLATVSLLFWPRGTESPFAERLATARARLTAPIWAVIATGALGMVLVGSWIFFNTSVRNEYLDRGRIFQRMVDYEQSYKQYADVPLPRITSVFAEVDLFPEARRAEIRGRYRLENKGAEPIRMLPISRSSRWVEGVLRVYGGVQLEEIDLPEHETLVRDEDLGFYVFELRKPLAVGESMELGFKVSVDHGGLVNSRHNHLIVDNGTFFSNRNFLPVVGYSRDNQLGDPIERRKHGLSKAARAADLDDSAARQRNYLDSDWIDFETIISTELDQVAIAPGDLVRQWVDLDRNYFHYKTSTPIVNLLPFLSGRYEVARERWNEVDIEVYYHPDHAFNIDRFLQTTKISLEYLTQSLGPYPHGQLRIVEVPSYHDKVAFAFAQTVPFSESWVFAADLEHADLGADGTDLDWLTGILAHEVAHQWWNHQVVPGNVQGATLIAESLSQYAAMVILEKMYGPQAVRHFLKFHLDRYLQRRGNESVREMPLERVENQAYIHYSKASLALYNLKDQVGQKVVDRALRSFLEKNTFRGPPYPTSRDLLAELRGVMPPDKLYLIEDLFETITLFDNRVVDATYTELDDGRFRVELETASLKLRDDGFGSTTEIEIDDWVDLGIFGEREVDGETREVVLVLEKHHLQSSDGTFSWVVDQRPVRAGIDPYNKLIDRDSGDNVRDLTQRAAR